MGIVFLPVHFAGMFLPQGTVVSCSRKEYPSFRAGNQASIFFFDFRELFLPFSRLTG
jgi:hypothetical protein